MDDEIYSQYLNILSTVYLFSMLDNNQLQELIQASEILEVEKNKVIFREGEYADNVYIIFSGRIQITKNNAGKSFVENYGQGECFGEDLILREKRFSQAVAQEDSKLIVIAKEFISRLCKSYPGLRRSILILEESRMLANRLNSTWLRNDEKIYYVVRKHEFALLKSLIIPSLLGLICIPLFLVSSLSRISLTTTVSLILTIICASASILLGIWNWLDWSNDYYVITNWRVIWTEKQIGIYLTRREVQINTILALDIISSQLGRWLGYGDVSLRTYTGGISMRYVYQPNLFSVFVKNAQVNLQKNNSLQERKSMEAAIRRKFGINNNELSIKESLSGEVRHSQIQPEQAKRKSFFSTEFAHFFQVRYENNGVITYRKHWLVLLRKIGLPTLTIFANLGLTAYVIINILSSRNDLITFPLWGIFLLFLYIVSIFWWLYQYLDWSNDIYRLTPTQLLDIEKKPLGKEDKKTAPLESILSIEHTRQGIIELIFNFGQVIISVGQAQFIFYDVNNPGRIHQDISDYIIAQNKRRAEAAEARDREHMVEWLDAYHQELKKNPNQKK